MFQRLRRSGIPVEEYTFTQASVGRLARNLHLLLRDELVQLIDHPILLDELRTVRLLNPGPGVWKIEHDPGRHNDAVMALALAAHKCLTIQQAQWFEQIETRRLGERDRIRYGLAHRYDHQTYTFTPGR